MASVPRPRGPQRSLRVADFAISVIASKTVGSRRVSRLDGFWYAPTATRDVDSCPACPACPGLGSHRFRSPSRGALVRSRFACPCGVEIRKSSSRLCDQGHAPPVLCRSQRLAPILDRGQIILTVGYDLKK